MLSINETSYVWFYEKKNLYITSMVNTSQNPMINLNQQSTFITSKCWLFSSVGVMSSLIYLPIDNILFFMFVSKVHDHKEILEIFSLSPCSSIMQKTSFKNINCYLLAMFTLNFRFSSVLIQHIDNWITFDNC